MVRSGARVIAVDWSGMLVGAERNIWLAEVVDGRPLRLENGRTREALGQHLLEEAERDPRLIVGLDFAFSLPAWFLRQHGLAGAPELWTLASCRAEAWLRADDGPFWGRPGSRRPSLPDHWRLTERAVPAIAGVRPKSVFQVGGAGAVGTGSLRGMPVLDRLYGAGFAVWPFDGQAWPLVVEIYPRLLTGPVSKKRQDQRTEYLARHLPDLASDLRDKAQASDDALDALVSALGMSRHLDELATLPSATDARVRLEGWIWYPGWREALALSGW